MKDRKKPVDSDDDHESANASNSDILDTEAKPKDLKTQRTELRTALVPQDDSDSDAQPVTHSRAPSKRSEKRKAEKLQGKIDARSKRVAAPALQIHPTDKALNDISDLKFCYKNKLSATLYYFFSVLTLGVLPLVDYWLEGEIFGRFVFKSIEDFAGATHVKVNAATCVYVPLAPRRLNLTESQEFEVQAFDFNHRTFFWCEEDSCFESISTWKGKLSAATFVEKSKKGLREEDAELLVATYGPNVVQIPKTLGFFSVVFSAFGVYCIAATFFLFAAELRGYALVFLTIVLFQAGFILLDRFRQTKKLQKQATVDERVMVVRRAGENLYRKRILESRELVPGDLIEVSNNLAMPADVLLIHGTCIVSENVSDGVTKTHTKESLAPDCKGSLSEVDSRHILKTGSNVLYTLNHVNEGCFGIVLRTGWATMYGDTARISISLHNSPTRICDALIFAFALGVSALVLAACEVLLGSARYNVYRTIALALCPVAPLAISLAFARARSRLRGKGFRVMRSEDIALVGEAKLFLVEQNATGEDPEKCAGFLLATPKESDYPSFEKLISKRSKLQAVATDSPSARRYIEALGLCNTLTKAGDVIYGSPIEAEMLKQTPFTLHNHVHERSEVERYFSCKTEGFSSRYVALRFLTKDKDCKGVVVKNAEGATTLFTHGEPFAVESMCLKKTVPYNFSQTVSRLATKGLRVTALAYRAIAAEENAQEVKLEKDLVFAGLYCSSAAAPPELSSAVADTMTNADVLLASDNCLFAAVFAARRSGIILPSTRVLACRTELVNNVETLICAELSKKSKEVGENSSLHEPLNFVDLDMISEDTFTGFDGIVAVTGPALNLILATFSPEGKRAVLTKCKVFGALRLEDRPVILENLREFVGPAGYVFEQSAPATTVRSAHVSVALGASDQQSAAFCSKTKSIEELATIVKHSRAALANKRKLASFVLVYLTLRLVGLVVLTFKHASFPNAQVFFLDIFVLLGLALFQSDCLGFVPERESRHHAIYSKQFFMALAPQAVFFVVITIFSVALMAKTKFYDVPMAVYGKNEIAHRPDKHFFYDPYLLFLMTAFLSMFHIFAINTGNFFRRQSQWKLALYAYWFFLACVLLLLLFRPARLALAGWLGRVFRAPAFFGFEIIVAFILIFSAIVVFLFRKYSPKYEREEKAPSVACDIKIVDRAQDCESHVEKKSKGSAREPQKPGKAKLPKKPRVSERHFDCAEEDSRERKVKPKRKAIS